MFTYSILYYEYIYLLKYEGRVDNIVYRVVPGFIALFISISVLYSRLLLGVHSLDQVILGSLIGLTMAIIYLIKLKGVIKSLLISFNSTSTDSGVVQTRMRDKVRERNVFILAGVMIV